MFLAVDVGLRIAEGNTSKAKVSLLQKHVSEEDTSTSLKKMSRRSKEVVDSASCSPGLGDPRTVDVG